jgi:hypothetical protein
MVRSHPAGQQRNRSAQRGLQYFSFAGILLKISTIFTKDLGQIYKVRR